MTDEKHDQSSVLQLVTFWVDGSEMGLPIHLVQEIIKPPEIHRIPNSAEGIDGIGNLRGQVLSVVNLRKRLKTPQHDIDEHSRIIVLKIGQTITGLLIDRVSEVLTIDTQLIESADTDMVGRHGSQVQSVAKLNSGKRLILVLSPQAILPELADVFADQDEKATLGQEVTEEVEQIVTFRLEGEEYALPISHVKEIIKIKAITPLRQANTNLLGLMALREKILPIVDLSKKFGLSRENDSLTDTKAWENSTRRIVVTESMGITMGFLVDSVSQVLRVSKTSIAEPPVMVNSSASKSIEGIVKLEQGHRLVFLLAPESLVDQDVRNAAMHAKKEGLTMETQQSTTQHKKAEEEVKYVCFRLGQEEYGLPIMRVQEIIKYNKITSVPNARDYIQGIINLRGHVVPVIDMRTRFGMSRNDELEQRRIVVLHVHDKTNGIVVDSVTEVLQLRVSQIEPPPSSISNMVDESFIDGIAKLGQGERIVILINPDKVIGHVDLQTPHKGAEEAANEVLPTAKVA